MNFLYIINYNFPFNKWMADSATHLPVGKPNEGILIQVFEPIFSANNRQ